MLENKLKAEARKKFPGDQERQDAYIYGTMRRRLGWTPKQQQEHMTKGGRK
jgi:hypothetical protein